MNTITYSMARQNLAGLMNKVCDDHEPVIITRKTENTVVLMSLEDFNSIQETMYLLQNPKNAKHLQESIQQFKKGKFQERVLIE